MSVEWALGKCVADAGVDAVFECLSDPLFFLDEQEPALVHGSA